MTKDETRLLCMPCLRGLAFITGIALATGLEAAPLTTASELAAVNRGERADATDFTLTATIVRICAPETTDSLCVADGSGYTTLRLPFNLRPAGLAAGCSLRLSGTIDYEAPLAPAIIATNCVVLADGPAPQARNVPIREVHSGKFDFQLVRVTAVVHDAFRDEIDKNFTFLVLLQDGQTLYAALPNEYLSEEDFKLFGNMLEAPRIVRTYVQVDAASTLIAPALKEELMRDKCVRTDIDYDYYAYLLSLTEVIPVDYGTRKGQKMDDLFFLGYQYMGAIYESILR